MKLRKVPHAWKISFKVISYSDFEKPFILHNDASYDGLGTVFLAVKWSFKEPFRDHLYYSKHFFAFTDVNPLTYILTAPKLDATGHR